MTAAWNLGTWQGATATAALVCFFAAVWFALAWRDERRARRVNNAQASEEANELRSRLSGTYPAEGEFPWTPVWPDWVWPLARDYPLSPPEDD